MPNPEFKKMTAMHFYGWERGLKTGQYYLRSRPARDAIKFTVNMETLLAATEGKDEKEILKALTKVEKVKETKKLEKTQSETVKSKAKGVNLGRKTAQPAGGFAEEGELDSDPKKQKTDAVAAKDDGESSGGLFECENCGS